MDIIRLFNSFKRVLNIFAGRVISKLKFQGVFDVVMKGIMLNYISCNIYHFF